MGMRKRMGLSLGLLAVLGVVGLLSVHWLSAPRHRITAETIAKITPGMAQWEVEDLLGAPAGFQVRGRVFRPYHYSGPEYGNWEWWVGDEAAVLVFFDAAGRVLHHQQLDAVPDDTPLFDKLRRWLHL